MRRFTTFNAVLTTLLAIGRTNGGDESPNLLLITMDALHADRLACCGGNPSVGTGVAGRIPDHGVGTRGPERARLPRVDA